MDLQLEKIKNTNLDILSTLDKYFFFNYYQKLTDLSSNYFKFHTISIINH